MHLGDGRGAGDGEWRNTPGPTTNARLLAFRCEGWKDFDSANAKLARLFKEVFPEDSEIQAIEE